MKVFVTIFAFIYFDFYTSTGFAHKYTWRKHDVGGEEVTSLNEDSDMEKFVSDPDMSFENNAMELTPVFEEFVPILIDSKADSLKTFGSSLRLNARRMKRSPQETMPAKQDSCIAKFQPCRRHTDCCEKYCSWKLGWICFDYYSDYGK